jgi:hypothetical protein
MEQEQNVERAYHFECYYEPLFSTNDGRKRCPPILRERWIRQQLQGYELGQPHAESMASVRFREPRELNSTLKGAG